jgi:hypothetical protein
LRARVTGCGQVCHHRQNRHGRSGSARRHGAVQAHIGRMPIHPRCCQDTRPIDHHAPRVVERGRIAMNLQLLADRTIQIAHLGIGRGEDDPALPGSLLRARSQ